MEAQSHEEMELLNGDAVIFQVTNKLTGEVVPHVTQGSDSNQQQFVVFADGTSVSFPNDLYDIKAI
jgi:hypothetical protein